MKSVLLAGLLPVILFTIIEEKYGTVAGLVVGMVYGLGEITFEMIKYKRVAKMTWFGNGLLLFFGTISLLTKEGFWFKLQPAIIEAVMAIFCWGSLILKKPFLWEMAKAQGVFEREKPEVMEKLRIGFSALTLRFGIFLFAHSILATFAALHWSTRAWMLLKGVGFTVSMLIYLVIEVIYLRIILAR